MKAEEARMRSVEAKAARVAKLVDVALRRIAEVAAQGGSWIRGPFGGANFEFDPDDEAMALGRLRDLGYAVRRGWFGLPAAVSWAESRGGEG